VTIKNTRINSADQSLNLKMNALNEHGWEEIFQEKMSGAKDD
jgi:hypothetical protein